MNYCRLFRGAFAAGGLLHLATQTVYVPKILCGQTAGITTFLSGPPGPHSKRLDAPPGVSKFGQEVDVGKVPSRCWFPISNFKFPRRDSRLVRARCWAAFLAMIVDRGALSTEISLV